MVSRAINAAIKIVGGQQKLTDACRVKQPSVWAWLHGEKKVLAENAKRTELAIEGNVPTYQIRSDLSDLLPHPNQAAQATPLFTMAVWPAQLKSQFQ